MSNRINNIQITGMVAALEETTSKKGMGMKIFTLLPSASKLQNAAISVLAFDKDNPGYAGIVEGAEVVIAGKISASKDPDSGTVELVVLTSNVKGLEKPDMKRNGVAVTLRAYQVTAFQARGRNCYRVRASLWTGKDKPMIWLNVTAFDQKPNELLGSLGKNEDFILEGNLGFSTWTRSDGTESASFEINAKSVGFLEAADEEYIPDEPEDQAEPPAYSEPQQPPVYAQAPVPAGPISMTPMEEPELDF